MTSGASAASDSMAKSGAGAWRSVGSPSRLIQKVVNPNAFAPAASQPFDETNAMGAGKRRQLAVRVEQPLPLRRRKGQDKRRDRVVERMRGQCRKILAHEFAARHQRLEPRVLELLRAPNARQGGAVAWRKPFGEGG